MNIGFQACLATVQAGGAGLGPCGSWQWQIRNWVESRSPTFFDWRLRLVSLANPTFANFKSPFCSLNPYGLVGSFREFSFEFCVSLCWIVGYEGYSSFSHVKIEVATFPSCERGCGLVLRMTLRPSNLIFLT